MIIIFPSSYKLNNLIKKYNGRKSRCVHTTLLLRTLNILKNLNPDTELFFAPFTKTLAVYAKRPDKKGDYENGIGRHYYCAVNIFGKELYPVNTYLRNGLKKFYKSARVMLEEDYTMALTMYHAGYLNQSMEFLGRAIHMLSDICCLPHSSSMTYFSTRRNFHKLYEQLAELIYPDLVPEQKNPQIPHIFTSRNSFADDINKISLETARYFSDIKKSPFEALQKQLLRTECILAAFLMRFIRDITTPEREAHYITKNSGCRLLRGTDKLSVKITKRGIRFHGVNPSPESDINVTGTVFYAAHRHDGLFTLSPEKSKEGLVLEVSDGKFVWKKFDPVHGEQLFKL